MLTCNSGLKLQTLITSTKIYRYNTKIMQKMKLEFKRDPREKIVFYFKILLCLFLIALWSFWFTYSSKKESLFKKVSKHSDSTNNKNIKSFRIKQSEEIFQSDEKEAKRIVHQSTSASVSKISDSKVRKEKGDLQNKLLKELPKLVTLTPVKTNEPDLKNEKPKHENIIPKEMINLNLPNTASATRKALLKNTLEAKQGTDHSIPLRKGIPIEKNKLKPVSIRLKEARNKDLNIQKTNVDEGWLPKYKKETKETESRDKDISENPDKIAEQIELAGIVNKPNGESTAIIRNKSNNYIEILKTGDEYKGLKLLEINKSEVVLGNQSLNKRYTKKINVGK